MNLKLRTAFDLAAVARDAGKRGRIEMKPIGARLSFEVALYRIILRVLAVYEKAKPALIEGARADRSTLTMDAFGISDIVSALRGSFSQAIALADNPLRDLFRGEGARHDSRWIEQVNSVIGVDLNAVVTSEQVQPAIDLATRRNVALIKGLTDEVAARIEVAITDLVSRGASTKEIAARLTEIGGFGRRRAQLIAVTEANKFNGELNRIRQTQAGISRYTWSTVRDNRVRPKHRAREGQTYRWDTPPQGGPPGSEPRCRCVARAVLDFDEPAIRRSERRRASTQGRRAVEAALTGFTP
ncbi:phage head morphogenesis protein [Methylorubrum suomiense]|uniref:Phage head morphogenesis domain-containing protein n=1 Tax=Methylorubrum suomiense TaxID=144191 RepID=A0ABQ4UY45_9HYPH|nr:phage minor head protein [Methylorubrum suomiense]GJE77266.1 hypothetical protein BGCPKDLD_3869 [Methylorubrum suomiense]